MVEAHGTTVHVAWLDLHTVEVQPLHKEPCEGAEEEVVQEDGDHGAHQLVLGPVDPQQEEELCHPQGSSHVGMDPTYVGLEAA